MKNTYYTPNIEEIHVGFEYEFHGMTTGGLVVLDAKKDKLIKYTEPNIKVWSKEKLQKDCFSTFNRTLNSIEELIESNQIRIKYLDKDDIEDFGFVNINDRGMSENYGFLFKNKDYTLKFWYISRRIQIEGIFIHITKFDGIINNKSELKKLMKQLEIT